jgi:hypothetical protein
MAPPEMSQVPTAWLSEPFSSALRKAVKPATSRTRRRLVQVRAKVPEEVFQDFVACLEDGDALGVQRDDSGKLVPTKTTQTSQIYDYTIKKPTVVGKLFSLEDRDPKPAPGAREPGAWHRGFKSSMLVLSQNGHKKGKKGEKVSMVAGTVRVHCRIPRRWKGWPTLTVRYFVLTMAHNGTITWPAKFTQTSRALLRKQVRQHVTAMLEDDRYPVHAQMSSCLTTGGDSFLQLARSNQDPENPLEPEAQQQQ